MKKLITVLLLAIAVYGHAESTTPLSKYSPEWSDPKYKSCNTAANVRYLTAEEKELVYILNMARMNPQLFCKTVLPQANNISEFADLSSPYYKSLVEEMSTMQPMGILTPDSLCYVSANCHCLTSGSKGYVGHVRQSADCRKKEHFHGECCQFGVTDPLGILLNLLIDQDTESLGHRRICLGKEYTRMSPSIAPHKQYGTMTTMDFY